MSEADATEAGVLTELRAIRRSLERSDAPAVMTLTQAARYLQMGDEDAADWLRARELVCDVGGRPRVLRADVDDALRGSRVQAAAPAKKYRIARV